MQEAVKSVCTRFHTIVLSGIHGLIEAPSLRPVRAEYRADSYRRFAIKMLDRRGPNAANSHGATRPPAAMASNFSGAVLHVSRENGVCALSGQTIAQVMPCIALASRTRFPETSGL
jgi:hypothetical protein